MQAFDALPLNTAGELLRRWAGAKPHAAALKTPGAGITYGEVLRAAQRACAQLQALGVRRADVVAFQLPNWIEAVVLYYAILECGAVAVPILPAMREHDLRYMLGQVNARVFVTPAAWRGTDHLALARRSAGPEVALATIAPRSGGWGVTELLQPAGRGEWSRVVADDPPRVPEGEGLDAVTTMIFTSGTSGRPKAVVYDHRCLAIEGAQMARLDGVGSDDVLFVPASVAHVAGICFAIHMPLSVGCTACLLPEWDPEAARQWMEEQGCTWTAGATPFLQGIVAAATAHGTGRPSRLRVFRCGGASVSPALIRKARALGIDAYRSYGLSEHPTVTGHAGQAPAACVDTDGAVHPHVQVRIVDPADSARTLAPGEAGEVAVKGPDQSRGYLRPEDNQGTQRDGWFLTGDIGRLSAEGHLSITGRKKDIIIRKGENIAARELEDLLLEHPEVSEVAAIGLPDAERGEMVCCVIVSRGPATPSLADCCAWLRGAGLATYKLPERLEYVAALPRNPGGKVLKDALRQRFASPAETRT